MLLEHLQILVSSGKGFETNPQKSPVNSYECVNISKEHEYTHKHASRFSQSVSTETILPENFSYHMKVKCALRTENTRGCMGWLSWKSTCLESIRTRVQDPRKMVKKNRAWWPTLAVQPWRGSDEGIPGGLRSASLL